LSRFGGTFSSFFDPKQKKQPISGSGICFLMAKAPRLILPPCLSTSEPLEEEDSTNYPQPLFTLASPHWLISN
jgi:hypothetical protein